MMSYEEAAAEIKRRRDSELQRRKNNRKKLMITLCAFVLCISVGAGAWMMSRDGGNVPAVDRSEATETTETTETAETDGILAAEPELPDWVPEEYTYVGNMNSHSSHKFSLIYLNEFVESDQMCIVGEDTTIPDTLPVFYKKTRTGIIDENYDREAINAETERFLELVYGEDFEERIYQKTLYYINDTYLAPNPDGDTFIGVNGEFIRIPLEITRVEKYRDMSYREALEYATSTKYYEAICEYLGLSELKSSGYVSSKVSEVNDRYTYNYVLASPKTDFTDGMMKNTETYIHIEMSFVRTEGKEKIGLTYYAYRQFDENSANYDKTVEHTTVPFSEAVANVPQMNSPEFQYIDLDAVVETVVSIEYRHSTNAAYDTPHCVMPFYNICFKLKDPVGGFTYSKIITVPAVEGMDEYYAEPYYTN